MLQSMNHMRATAFGWLALSAIGMVQAQTVTVGGTGSALEAIRQVGAAMAAKDKDLQLVVLPSIGSAGAIKGLIGQSVDVGLLARPLKDTETAQGLKATRLAQTPVVVATNRRGEKNITGAQLEAFYSGAVVRWSDNSAVRLVLRPLADTDNQLIATLTPGMKAALEAAAAREGLLTASTDQDSADGLEKLPGSLGTAALSLLLFEKRKLEVLALNGVAPLVRGKVNMDYPLMKPLYVVSREDAKPAARRLIQFLLSAPGQAILEKSGYTHEFR
jgi:phosphate transport system substrate-binding protein